MAARQFSRDPGRPSKSHEERKLLDERDTTSWTGFPGLAMFKDFSISRSRGTLKKSPSKVELKKQTIQNRSKARGRKELGKSNPLSTSSTTKGATMLPILDEDHEEGSAAPVTPTTAPTATTNVTATPTSQRTLYADPPSLLAKRTQEELINIIVSLRNENSKMRISHVSTVIPQRKTSTTVGTLGSADRSMELKLLAYTKEIDLLKAEIQEEKSKVSQAEKHKDITLRKMAEITKMEGNLYDDRHFCEEVEELRYTLSDWCGHQNWQAGNFSRQSPSPTRLTFRKVFKDTCRQLSNYMSEIKIADLIEAFIWEFLVYEIFGQYLWAEQGKEQNIAKKMKSWNDYMRQITDVEKEQYAQVFHEHRVASTRIVALRASVAKPHILEAVKEKIQRLNNDLSVFACRTLDTESLVEIFASAVDLDSLMEQQRPKFMFSPLFAELYDRRDLSFNRAEMETLTEDSDTRQDNERHVVLVRRPGLWKFGNAAGKDYGRQICILPAIVDLESR